MGRPVSAQRIQRHLGQWHIAILLALAQPDMNPPMGGVDIADLQLQAFAKAQAHAVDRKEEDAIAQLAHTVDQPPGFFYGQDIRQ